MLENLKKDAKQRMQKSVAALSQGLTKLRTGRAHPSLLEQITVSYYGNDAPLNQVANIAVEDSRTLSITPWEPQMVSAIEKAVQNSQLGLNPVTAGRIIRVPLPDLTEDRRKDLARLVKHEAEQARVAVRNVRRDVLTELKALLKGKQITEDDERRTEQEVQKITDKSIADIDKVSEEKQQEIMVF
jgi:ribosome recycling factor